MGCAITTISSNLTEMSKGVKLLAALMDDEVGSGEDLLRAARTLAGAVSDLLKAVQPTSGEVSSWGKAISWVLLQQVQPLSSRDGVLAARAVPSVLMGHMKAQ